MLASPAKVWFSETARAIRSQLGMGAVTRPYILETGKFDCLESYVREVIGKFASDPRVHGWDIWNEPSNENIGTYGSRDLGSSKCALVEYALRTALFWAHDTRPSQPITAGLWRRDIAGKTPSSLVELQVSGSDVVSFHEYLGAQPVREVIAKLAKFGRPILCTEFMARPQGGTFQEILPVLQENGVNAYSWGLVSGKSQTIFPWNSHQYRYEAEPNPWFHDILRPDGSAYLEVDASFCASFSPGQVHSFCRVERLQACSGASITRTGV